MKKEEKKKPFEWQLDKEFHHVALVYSSWKSIWNRKVTRNYMRKAINTKDVYWHRNIHKIDLDEFDNIRRLGGQELDDYFKKGKIDQEVWVVADNNSNFKNINPIKR